MYRQLKITYVYEKGECQFKMTYIPFLSYLNLINNYKRKEELKSIIALQNRKVCYQWTSNFEKCTEVWM